MGRTWKLEQNIPRYEITINNCIFSPRCQSSFSSPASHWSTSGQAFIGPYRLYTTLSDCSVLTSAPRTQALSGETDGSPLPLDECPLPLEDQLNKQPLRLPAKGRWITTSPPNLSAYVTSITFPLLLPLCFFPSALHCATAVVWRIFQLRRCMFDL